MPQIDPQMARNVLDTLLQEARNRQAAQEAEAAAVRAAAANSGQVQMAKTLSDLATGVAAIAQHNKLMEQRLASIEGRGNTPTGDDPAIYGALNELGIERKHLEPIIQHEVNERVNALVDKKLDETFGPAKRQAEAIREFKNKNPDFDLDRLNQFLSKNPEVDTLVQQAAAGGAFEVGIRYGETRRQMDEKIQGEAKVRARSNSREQLIADTRPDAQIVGGTGANGDRSNVTTPMTAEQIEGVFAHANAGNWTPFEKSFVSASLPSEEFFQQLAQS